MPSPLRSGKSRSQSVNKARGILQRRKSKKPENGRACHRLNNWEKTEPEFNLRSSETNSMLLLLLSRSVTSDSVRPHRWLPTRLPPSLGFSRQEHWSGLPFPSPMHESEKWKWSRSVMSDSQRPNGLQPTRLLCPWDFPGKSTGVGCHC